MQVKQLYTNCLAEAAYYIESEGEVAIIDPLREIAPYLELAGKIKVATATTRYVFETHFHADFVSGHIDLAKATGAQIIFGPGANTKYEIYNAKDGEEFSLGKVKIKAIHTPGHTLESTCYLLYDEQGKEYAIFTGDTLFVGDVGRPDLLDGTMSKEELAGMMYDSLNNKIKKLSDHVIVYPAHGPGSQCGKNLGSETWSTIGEQKKTNYALQNMTREEFIKVLTEGILPPPKYFFADAKINKEGYTNFDEVMKQNYKPLELEQFERLVQEGAMILDTRSANTFAEGFIKNAFNIGLDGSFAIWVGTMLDIERKIILITEPGKEQEAIMRLARVGYENVVGFLEGGIATWKNANKPLETIELIEPDGFAQRYDKENNKVLDVRKVSELENGHVPGIINIPLSELGDNLEQLDKNEKYLVHCRSGYRSMIAASILKANGFDNIVNVVGGFNKIKETNVPIVVNELTA